MFVIVYDDRVILGPMRWQKFRFENTIKEDCDFTANLNMRNDNNEPVIVSDRIKILPVQGSDNPPHNPRIEILHGPFWDFSNNIATHSYQPVRISLEAAVTFLKHEVKEERKRRLLKKVPVTINQTEYMFDTSDRTITSLNHALTAQLPTINYKLDTDIWITMSPSDALNTLNTIIAYIQSCFDWELNKQNEINACTTLEQLVDIVVKEENSN